VLQVAELGQETGPPFGQIRGVGFVGPAASRSRFFISASAV